MTSKGAGNVCVYINCYNTRRNTPGLKMFRFPLKDTQRAKKWILNCGNTSLLDLTPEELHKCLLCEDHFKPSQYNDPLSRIRLHKMAIPTAYDEAETPFINNTIFIKTYSRVYTPLEPRELSDQKDSSATSSFKSLEDIIKMPTLKQNHSKKFIIPLQCQVKQVEMKVARLKAKLSEKAKKIRLQASKLSKLKATIKKLHLPNSPINLGVFKSRDSKTLVKMQAKAIKNNGIRRRRLFKYL